MAYRNSILSLYPPPPTTPTATNSPKEDLTSHFEVIPATAPVFEGHLYLRTDKKQWQWRLFRFDGTSFTCLSTRKVKLPPNTHVDAPPLNDPLLLQSLPSFTSISLTSPLLATPKSKSHQKSNTLTTSPLASYYQLPKWTVDVVNISAVSVLKPSSSNNGTKKKKLPIISQKQSRCFCVRTFDGNCYIMKAHKQKDLERWLFVLTKMWKFTLAMKLQLSSQQPQHQQILRQQQQQQLPYLQSSSSLLLSTQSQQQMMSQQLRQSQDTIPLSRMYQRPQHTTLEESNIVDHPLSTIKSQPQMNAGLTSHPPTKSSIDYEKRYHHPILSVEKSECIDAWRQSLCELMASDPQLQVSVPPPIESIPDDDKVSIISDMTSISHRKPALRRRASIVSTASRRSSRSSKLKPRASVAAPRLKKKRSNDVKNWIEPRKTDNHNHLIAPLAALAAANTTTIPSSNVAPTDAYHVGYFQDCKTTAGSTSMTSLDLDGNDDPIDNDDDEDDDKKRIHKHNQRPDKDTTGDRHVKYHHSTRAKQVHITNARHPSAVDTPAHQQPTSLESHPIDRALEDNGNHSAKPTSSSFTTQSPLYSLAHIDTRRHVQPEDEEEISLADLQRSLKRTSLHPSSGIATTSSSSLTAPATHHRQPPYHSHTPPHHLYYQPYVPSPSTSGMSITAPAIPPMPHHTMASPSTFLPRPFTQTHRPGTNNNGGSLNDVYRQPNRKPKKPQTDQQQHQQQEQRRNSWVSSCEQQKIMPLRQSVHLDTVHW